MGFLVHPLHAEHYAGTRALILAAAPERGECAHTLGQMPNDPEGGYVRQDYVAVDVADAHQVIGYGAIWPQREGRFRMDLIVAQAWRRQGVGSALLQTLSEALRAQNAVIVQARTPDYRPESLTFLMRRGFTETNRMIHLRLLVAEASTASLPTLTAHLGAQGVTVVTLDREQTRTADWLARIQELIRATMPERVGNPYRVGSDAEICSAEDAARIWESYRPLSTEAFFLATQGKRYLGLSFLSTENTTKPEIQGETAIHQGDTAVHLDWRRQGIATLLKLHTIAYAQQKGYDTISTSTASSGMLALNERLGFRQEWTEVRLVNEIQKL